ncbi:MAG: acyloxyacyl hydrolase [Bacteroidota bacterium]
MYYLKTIALLALISAFIWVAPHDALATSGSDTLKNQPIYIGAKLQYGSIIPHSSELIPISQTNPAGFQLEVSRLMTRQKSWDHCNCYARTGFSFLYINYGNPEILGNSYNLAFFTEPYINFKSRFRMSFRAGAGVSYLNQVFDEESNPTNVFYSSSISYLLLLNLTANYKIKPQLNLNLSANYNHISNGGMRQPNKGINFPTLSLGMDYVLNPVALVPKPKNNGLLGSKTKKYARLFATIRTVDETPEFEEERKLMLGLEAGLIKGISPFNALSGGIELIRDGSLREKSIRDDLGHDHHILSLLVGHHLIFGRFGFSQQLGYYAYKPFPFNDRQFYQRYTLYQQLGEYLNVGFSLKSHGHIAEHIDVRIGVMF